MKSKNIMIYQELRSDCNPLKEHTQEIFQEWGGGNKRAPILFVPLPGKKCPPTEWFTENEIIFILCGYFHFYS